MLWMQIRSGLHIFNIFDLQPTATPWNMLVPKFHT